MALNYVNTLIDALSFGHNHDDDLHNLLLAKNYLTADSLKVLVSLMARANALANRKPEAKEYIKRIVQASL